MLQQIASLTQQIEACDKELEQIAQTAPAQLTFFCIACGWTGLHSNRCATASRY